MDNKDDFGNYFPNGDFTLSDDRADPWEAILVGASEGDPSLVDIVKDEQGQSLAKLKFHTRGVRFQHFPLVIATAGNYLLEYSFASSYKPDGNKPCEISAVFSHNWEGLTVIRHQTRPEWTDAKLTFHLPRDDWSFVFWMVIIGSQPAGTTEYAAFRNFSFRKLREGEQEKFGCSAVSLEDWKREAERFSKT